MSMRLFHCTLHGDAVTVTEVPERDRDDVVRAFYFSRSISIDHTLGMSFTRFLSTETTVWVAVVGKREDDLEEEVKEEIEWVKDIVFR